MRSGLQKKLYDAWYGLLRRYGVHPGPVSPLCQRWRSLPAFVEDLGEPPDDQAVLCRRDRRAGWRPGNVFWGTPRQRQQSVLHAHILEHNGRRQSLAAWAHELGILPRTLRERLQKTSVAEALVTKAAYHPPPRQRPKSPHRSSVFRGVYRHGRKWEARLKVDGELLYLGLFLRETDAARAVERLRLEREAILQAKRIATGDPPPRGTLPEQLGAMIQTIRQAVMMSPNWPPPGGDPARLSSKFKITKEERLRLV